MTDHSKDTRTKTELLAEIERLQFRLQEAEETREAIRSADVDALVVAGPRGEQVFSITGAEHIYRVIVETMNEAALTVDLDGTILFCNQRFCDLLKTPIQGVIGRKMMTFVARPQQLPLRALLASAQTGPVQRRLTLRAADGSTVPVQLAASPLEVSGGTSICLVATDLTELEVFANSVRILREHQQALEESEARFRTMLEASQDAIVITDDAGVCVQANPAVAALFGLPREQLLGHKLSEFLDDIPDFPTFWQTFLATGSFRDELSVSNSQGQRREVDFYAVTNILPGRHMSVLRDITERKRAQWALKEMNEELQIQAEELRVQSEELRVRTAELQVQKDELAATNAALRQSEERLRLAQQAGRVGVFDRDLQNNTAVWTPELEELFGIPAGTFEGKPEDWAKRVYPEDLPRMTSFLQEWMQSARTEETWEYRFIREDSQVRWMEGRGRIFRDPNGKPLRMIGTNVDITERKRAEEALQKSEEKFAKAFRSSPIAVAVTRLSDGRIIEVNEAMLKLLHFDRDEVIGHTTLDLGLWVDVNDRAALTQRLAAAGSARDLEYRLRTKDGAIVTIHLAAEVLDFSGEPCMLATLVDITERQRAEEALRESEERLKRTQGIAHLGSWELDLVSNRLSWSDEVYRIFGLTPQEFQATYEAFLECVHPDDRAAVDAAYSGSLREGRNAYEIEHQVVRRSTGEIRIVHEKCEHVRDASGRIIRSVGMVHDITERKHADEALRMSEERFRTLHALSPIAIVLNRLDTGQFLESNQALWDMTGYTEKEFRSLTYWDITPIDYQDMETQQLESLHTVGRYGPYEKEYIRKDGTRFPVLLSGVRIKDPTGTDLVYSVIQDITELKAKEKALRELNATLESKVAQRTAELQHRARQLQKLTLELSETEDRERRQLAEILHDDLQQQLAAAKFHLSLLNNRAQHDPAQQAIVAQVDEILMEAIQKSRSLSHELSPAVLYHGDFAGALAWLAGQVQTKHGLEVKVDAFGEVNIESEALKSFLYKAAQEMLFNVVKHARIDQARIRLRRFGRCVCLSVSDRGRGFDPQEVRQTAGFGLLSIRERVELLGGRMKMHSVKGQGSTFHVVVPDGPVIEKGYVGAGPRARPTLQGGPDDHGLGGHGGPPLRVLVADDHEIVREGLISLLSDLRDIEVVGEAANGREAVNQAYRLQPDVVVMDVAMPLINGDDATRQIKLHLPKTRVIALSMYEDPDMIEKMRRAGAEDYILKTAPSEVLVAAIRGKKPQPVPA